MPLRRSSPAVDVDQGEEATATVMDDGLRAMAEIATAGLATLAETVSGAVGGALAQVIARASGFTEEQQGAAVCLQRFQRARQDRKRWMRHAAYYWEHADALKRERAATVVQRQARAAAEGREARAACAHLRAWDALLGELGEARRQRTAAARVLQWWVRARRRQRRAREWRRKELLRRSSRTYMQAQNFQRVIEKKQEAQRLNPFSTTYYVGAEQHRKAVEAMVGGKLGRFGTPSEGAAEKALGGQVATMLNVLRLVDAVNAVIRASTPDVGPRGAEARGATGRGAEGRGAEGRGAEGRGATGLRVDLGRGLPRDATGPPRININAAAVALSGGEAAVDEGEWRRAAEEEESGPVNNRVRLAAECASLHFDELMRWNDQAIQARFSGVVQYLRSAKRHGLLDFSGEMPQGARIESRCMHWSRRALLERALERGLHLVVPTLSQPSGSAAEDLRRKIAKDFGAQLEEFINTSFEVEVDVPLPPPGGNALEA